VQRFLLKLQSLPDTLSEELKARLREVGWRQGELPAVLRSGLSESEANVLKSKLEFLGADVEILPEQEQTGSTGEPTLAFAFVDEDVRMPPVIQAPIEKTAFTAEEYEESTQPREDTREETREDSREESKIIEDGQLKDEVLEDQMLEDEVFEDEEFEDLEEENQKPARNNTILFALLGVLFLLGGYYLFWPSPAPRPHDSEADIVDVLLTEQERIIREEKRKRHAEKQKVVDTVQEIIGGNFQFGDPKSDKPPSFVGDIRFGRYKAGILIEQFSLKETSREKIPPIEIGVGKKPRPWLISLEANINQFSPRDPLGRAYLFTSDALAYLEDETGNLRIPCTLSLECNLSSGSRLKCGFQVKNKALAKNSDSLLMQPSVTVERDPHLGFLIAISGKFETTLNPIKTAELPGLTRQ